MSESLFQLNIATLSCLIVLALGVLTYFCLSKRGAEDVLEDLEDYTPNLVSQVQNKKEGTQGRIEKDKKQREQFNFINILSAPERSSLKKKLQVYLVIGCLLGLGAGFLFLKAKPVLLLAMGLLGLCLGYLISQKKLRALEERFKKEIVFFLPVVMERIVMAVQAGLDILPALKVIEEIESLATNPNCKSSRYGKDAVTKLLAQVVNLCESGLSFDQSLREVANSVKSNALRHAFIHLGVAQKEGGEILYPLRELSDATQLYFQESVEEDIAKMPIKATMPLLLTFAGLIISFMTGPVVQILNISANPKLISDSSGSTGAQQQIEAREVSGEFVK